MGRTRESRPALLLLPLRLYLLEPLPQNNTITAVTAVTPSTHYSCYPPQCIVPRMYLCIRARSSPAQIEYPLKYRSLFIFLSINLSQQISHLFCYNAYYDIVLWDWPVFSLVCAVNCCLEKTNLHQFTRRFCPTMRWVEINKEDSRSRRFFHFVQWWCPQEGRFFGKASKWPIIKIIRD